MNKQQKLKAPALRLNPSALPLIQSEIQLIRKRLVTISQDVGDSPTCWGEVKDTRELLRGRLDELREKEHAIQNALLHSKLGHLTELEHAAVRVRSDAMQSMPAILNMHRQNGQVDQEISLFTAILIITCFSFGAGALLLNSIDALVGHEPGYLTGVLRTITNMMGHLL